MAGVHKVERSLRPMARRANSGAVHCRINYPWIDGMPSSVTHESSETRVNYSACNGAEFDTGGCRKLREIRDEEKKKQYKLAKS